MKVAFWPSQQTSILAAVLLRPITSRQKPACLFSWRTDIGLLSAVATFKSLDCARRVNAGSDLVSDCVLARVLAIPWSLCVKRHSQRMNWTRFLITCIPVGVFASHELHLADVELVDPVSPGDNWSYARSSVATHRPTSYWLAANSKLGSQLLPNSSVREL